MKPQTVYVDAMQAINSVQIKIKIKRMREAKIRIAVGLFLVKVASLIIGCSVVVKEDEGEQT